MTDTLFALVPIYGVWVILVATFLSCLALPMPSSMLMLAGGAFVATGDLALLPVAGAAWVGAVAGDQAGYWLTRGAGRGWVERMSRRKGRGEAIARARDLLTRRGGVSVFLSRWLVSPLGPYVNFVAGAGGLDWRVFTLWGIAGEAVWVACYVGLGFTFTGSLSSLASILGNATGFLAAAVVAAGLGSYLFRAASRHAR